VRGCVNQGVRESGYRDTKSKKRQKSKEKSKEKSSSNETKKNENLPAEYPQGNLSDYSTNLPYLAGDYSADPLQFQWHYKRDRVRRGSRGAGGLIRWW
jgi:hypothetical protein